MVFQLDEDAEAPPIEEDDPSLPLYDTDVSFYIDATHSRIIRRIDTRMCTKMLLALYIFHIRS